MIRWFCFLQKKQIERWQGSISENLISGKHWRNLPIDFFKNNLLSYPIRFPENAPMIFIPHPTDKCHLPPPQQPQTLPKNI